VSFLIEKRLKEKDGTHKTSIRIKEAEIITVPISVTETSWPFGSLANLEVVAVIVVKNEREQTIWLVAPVFIIHGWLTSLEATGKVEMEEKTEWWE